MTKSNYNVQLLVDGKPIKEYTKDGKTFVEAKSGTEYVLRIKNNTSRRAVAVVSIDGINTITGEISKPDSTGYVVQAYNSIEVKGYRQDQTGGGRFKFTEKESGYSKEVDGSGINSGVIGVHFVAEKVKPITRVNEPEPFTPLPYYPSYPRRPRSPSIPGDQWPWSDPYYTLTCKSTTSGDPEAYSSTISSDVVKSANNSIKGSSSGRLMNSGSMMRSCSFAPDVPTVSNYCQVMDWHEAPTSNAPTFDRATTWGSKFEETLQYVDFARSSDTETLNVYYASRESLKKIGVIDDSPPQVTFPQSFPSFAKPPTGWKS